MSSPCQRGGVPPVYPFGLSAGNSGGIVRFGRLGVDFGAAAGLRLAALQVFPQGGLKPLLAPLFLGQFWAVRSIGAKLERDEAAEKAGDSRERFVTDFEALLLRFPMRRGKRRPGFSALFTRMGSMTTAFSRLCRRAAIAKMLQHFHDRLELPLGLLRPDERWALRLLPPTASAMRPACRRGGQTGRVRGAFRSSGSRAA